MIIAINDAINYLNYQQHLNIIPFFLFCNSDNRFFKTEHFISTL